MTDTKVVADFCVTIDGEEQIVSVEEQDCILCDIEDEMGRARVQDPIIWELVMNENRSRYGLYKSAGRRKFHVYKEYLLSLSVADYLHVLEAHQVLPGEDTLAEAAEAGVDVNGTLVATEATDEAMDES